jgi:hypothetical protein
VVNATCAIRATPIPWADSSTICARRHVTTEPVPRRMIRNSRLPSEDVKLFEAGSSGIC